MSGESVEQTVYVPLSLHLGQSTASPKRNSQETGLSMINNKGRKDQKVKQAENFRHEPELYTINNK
jgi:hypothetical protein